MELAAAFYQDTLKLGSPYKDEDYRGFWGRGYVFGIYTADFERDHIPREDRANGYISFWVNSATKIYSSLKKQNVQFPVIEAINDDSGISTEMGYKELVATDSEGNLVIFTEYSGRMK